MLHLLTLGLAAPEEPPKVTWEVNAPHGPGQDVSFETTTGTWMSADVSPDGQALLFDLLGDLYVLPLAGGEAKALTRGVAWDTDARWSPDGKRILYSSDAGGNEEIWSMAADGTGAARLTREDTDRYTDPAWAPEPGWFLARRRSVDTRSIGVQELWLLHEKGGAGVRLTSLDVDPHAGEAAFSPDGRYVWYSTRAGRFEYNHNPHQGLWQLVRWDRALAERVVVTDLAGGAARPTPSPDGSQLAFVTRDRTRSVLMLLDVATGRVRELTDTLDRDQMEGFELRGTYPRMDWTPDGKALVYWAGGGLWRLDVATGARTAVPFRASFTTRITDAVRPERRLDTANVHARVIRWPAVTPTGDVYAAALGRLWHIPPGGAARALTDETITAYFPSLSADGRQLAWVSWDDQQGGQVWVGPPGGRSVQVTATGADYQAPAVSPDGKEILFLRGSDTTARGGDLGGEGWYDLRIAPIPSGRRAPSDGVRVRSLAFRGSNQPAPRPQWSPDGSRIWWIQDEAPAGRVPETTVLVSCKRDGTDLRTHVRFPGAQEVRISPDFRHLLVRKGYQVYLAALPALGTTTMKEEELPSRKLTDSGGAWVSWISPDEVSWINGDELRRVKIDGLFDREAKQVPPSTATKLTIEAPRAEGRGLVAFVNARIVPVDAPPIARGTVLVDGRRIVGVGDVAVPAGARVIDLAGKTVLPGLVDVHAHLHYASGDVFPEQEWRHLVNLAYGVTTVFDPSASTDLVFGQAELVEAGRMAGPRVLSTGFILYGALSNLGLKMEKPEDAENALRRLQAAGAWGVKSYQQSKRSHRQWIVEAARKLGMLDVPEGGGELFQNLGMILDGHSSIEHALPVAPLYDDVVQLWARSRTAYVPTLLVAYGGVTGETAFYQQERPWADPFLTRFTPASVLVGRSYRLPLVLTDPEDFHHGKVAATAAKIREAGGLVALGAHGQLNGLGVHWEMEALGGPGAMTPARAIEAATLGGARHLGLERDLGSLTPGKVADLFVVDGDPLADLREARKVVWVMKDGLLYDAATMDLVSPEARKRAPLIWESAGPGGRANGVAEP